MITTIVCIIAIAVVVFIVWAHFHPDKAKREVERVEHQADDLFTKVESKAKEIFGKK